MVVNSLNFLFFFTVVFIIYYLPVCRKNERLRNAWIFLVSYFFYGVADWKMIPLLLGATAVFYALGLWLKDEMSKGHAKTASRITTLGVMLGVGVLLYFKYLNFFAESFAVLLNGIGLNVTWSTLNIVLPIGVSFFTFKLISYIIEIHREHIEPCRDFIKYGAYIAFFPTILSGPIDRPNKFLPQLSGNDKKFDYALAVDGCRQILWGMFTKMCIADNLAKITDLAWTDMGGQTSAYLLGAALVYPLQMYADFDGYSNMAIGVGKVLGVHIQRNFNHPFLARNIAEYWRNWHISLTGWLTDYVFSPLNIAFRNLGKLGITMAIIANFILIGFWHGANWTFGLFGLYHGLLYIPLIYSGTFGKKKKLKENKYHLPLSRDFIRMAGTYLLVAFGLVIFRAPNIGSFCQYIAEMSARGIIGSPHLGLELHTYIFIFILVLLEWFTRKKEYALQDCSKYRIVRWVIYYVICSLIFQYQGSNQEFIYFQF